MGAAAAVAAALVVAPAPASICTILYRATPQKMAGVLACVQVHKTCTDYYWELAMYIAKQCVGCLPKVCSHVCASSPLSHTQFPPTTIRKPVVEEPSVRCPASSASVDSGPVLFSHRHSAWIERGRTAHGLDEVWIGMFADYPRQALTTNNHPWSTTILKCVTVWNRALLSCVQCIC